MGIYINASEFFKLAMLIWISWRSISVVIRMKTKRFSLMKELRSSVMCVYALIVGTLTFFPLRLDFKPIGDVWSHVNLIPLVTTLEKALVYKNHLVFNANVISFWAVNIFGNMLLFVPLGYALPLFFRRVDSLWKALAMVIAVSLGIEMLQLTTLFLGNDFRAFDIDDILMNTLGGAIGFMVFTTCHFKYMEGVVFKWIRNY